MLYLTPPLYVRFVFSGFKYSISRTLLAKAVATEFSMYFISVKGYVTNERVFSIAFYYVE